MAYWCSKPDEDVTDEDRYEMIADAHGAYSHLFQHLLETRMSTEDLIGLGRWLNDDK